MKGAFFDIYNICDYQFFRNVMLNNKPIKYKEVLEHADRNNRRIGRYTNRAIRFEEGTENIRVMHDFNHLVTVMPDDSVVMTRNVSGNGHNAFVSSFMNTHIISDVKSNGIVMVTPNGSYYPVFEGMTVKRRFKNDTSSTWFLEGDVEFAKRRVKPSRVKEVREKYSDFVKSASTMINLMGIDEFFRQSVEAYQGQWIHSTNAAGVYVGTRNPHFGMHVSLHYFMDLIGQKDYLGAALNLYVYQKDRQHLTPNVTSGEYLIPYRAYKATPEAVRMWLTRLSLPLFLEAEEAYIYDPLQLPIAPTSSTWGYRLKHNGVVINQNFN